jgi:hypothetical protein
VEKKLNDLFQMASNWDAVLLFDEADVLLEMRTDQAQLKRNSLVSGSYKFTLCSYFSVLTNNSQFSSKSLSTMKEF